MGPPLEISNRESCTPSGGFYRNSSEHPHTMRVFALVATSRYLIPELERLD